MKRTELDAESEGIASRLSDVLQSAVALMQDAAFLPANSVDDKPGKGNLLDQCLALCAEHGSRPTEPIRTIHHFACTGGTLISKCISAMPNVQLLSEVDPLSGHGARQNSLQFAPSDLSVVLRSSTRGTDDRLLARLFESNLRTILDDATQTGYRLVLRDHAHSHFCVGAEVPSRPTLIELLPKDVPRHSILTVRNPIDSYLSLVENGWTHFSPPSIDEYAKRYLSFLDAYEGLPRYRYEDFVASPGPLMRAMCNALAISFYDGFESVFDVFELSGDSGRRGSEIALRSPRPRGKRLVEEAGTSAACMLLLDRLGYERPVEFTLP